VRTCARLADLKLQVAQRKERQVGERESEAHLDLLLALRFEPELSAISRSAASCGSVTSCTVSTCNGFSPGRPGRSGRCVPASLPLAKVEQQEIIATVPAGEV